MGILCIYSKFSLTEKVKVIESGLYILPEEISKIPAVRKITTPGSQ